MVTLGHFLHLSVIRTRPSFPALRSIVCECGQKCYKHLLDVGQVGEASSRDSFPSVSKVASVTCALSENQAAGSRGLWRVARVA